MSDIPPDSLPPEIAELLANTPKTTAATLERLRKAGESLETDPAFQSDLLKSLYVANVMEAMADKKVSQSDLARRWGKSRQYLHKLLNEDKRINFTIETMVELAMLLDRRLEMHMLKKDEAAHVLRCRVHKPECPVTKLDEGFSVHWPDRAILPFQISQKVETRLPQSPHGAELSA